MWAFRMAVFFSLFSQPVSKLATQPCGPTSQNPIGQCVAPPAGRAGQPAPHPLPFSPLPNDKQHCFLFFKATHSCMYDSPQINYY